MTTPRRSLIAVLFVLAPSLIATGAQPVTVPIVSPRQPGGSSQISIGAKPYLTEGTLPYHLATNATSRAKGFEGNYYDALELTGWGHREFVGTNMIYLTNAVWSSNFWLKGVRGLSATCIGFSNRYSGQGLVTMISPRHCLFAQHMHQGQDHFIAAFLDTNNIVHWRENIQTVHLTNDISLGILNQDLPPSVGFLPVLPTNFMNYLPANPMDVVQGLGMNQDMRVFSAPVMFGIPGIVLWNSTISVPQGLGKNWNAALRAGDSSDPVRLLIGNQLVLISHNAAAGAGPSYAFYFSAINEQMRNLSKKIRAKSNYQLTPVSLSNWTAIR